MCAYYNASLIPNLSWFVYPPDKLRSPGPWAQPLGGAQFPHSKYSKWRWIRLMNGWLVFMQDQETVQSLELYCTRRTSHWLWGRGKSKSYGSTLSSCLWRITTRISFKKEKISWNYSGSLGQRESIDTCNVRQYYIQTTEHFGPIF